MRSMHTYSKRRCSDVGHCPEQLLATWGMVRAQEIEAERARLRDSASEREGRGEAAEAAAEREAADAPVVVMTEDVRVGLLHVLAPRCAALRSQAVCRVRRDHYFEWRSYACMLVPTMRFLLCLPCGVRALCTLPHGWPLRVRADLDHAPQRAAPRLGHLRAAPSSRRMREAPSTPSASRGRRGLGNTPAGTCSCPPQARTCAQLRDTLRPGGAPALMRALYRDYLFARADAAKRPSAGGRGGGGGGGGRGQRGGRGGRGANIAEKCAPGRSRR